MLLTLILFPAIQAAPEITQIKPIGAEFLQIETSKNISFEGATIKSPSDATNYNTLSLEQNKSNSNKTLIIGSNFEEKNNLNDLDCTIYQTDRSQVAFGGMSNSGEEIKISSDNLTLNWNPDRKYSLDDNQSINTLANEKIESSPCSKVSNSTNNNENQQENQNTKYQSKKNKINISDECLFCDCPNDFEIRTPSLLQKDSIKYDFKTSIENPEIKYWVEYFNGSIARSPFTTSSLSTKTYTPTKTGAYIINAILNTSECKIKDRQMTFFQKKGENIKEDEIKNSSIKIENKDELKNNKAEEIEYTVYRGDTLKRVVYVKLDNKELTSFETDQMSSTSGSIKMPEINSPKKLTIKGLGIKKELNITPKQNDDSTHKSSSQSTQTSPNQKSSKNEKDTPDSSKSMEFNITNTNQNQQNLTIDFTTTHKGDILCRVVIRRTEISNTIEDTFSHGKNTMTLNLKPNKTEKMNESELKNSQIFCQYKKSELKTFNSYRKDLDLNQEIIEDELQQELLSKQSKSTNDTNKNMTTQSNANKESSSHTEEIKSQNIKLKDITIYAFVALTLITLIAIIFFWKK